MKQMIRGYSSEWWYPTLANHADKSAWSDEELLNHYVKIGDGKYSVQWDHVGDAYDEYKELADALLLLIKNIEENHD